MHDKKIILVFLSIYFLTKEIRASDCPGNSYKFFIIISVDSYSSTFCAGSLVRNDVVLSAANCFYNKVYMTDTDAYAYAGVRNLLDIIKDSRRHIKDPDELVKRNIQISKVDRIHYHPDFKNKPLKGQKHVLAYDIVYLILENKFTLGKNVQLINIPLPFSKENEKKCTNLEIVGFGSQEIYSLNTLKDRIKEMGVDTNLQCEKGKKIIKGDVICMDIKDVCNGDPGGPILCGNIQVGVISLYGSCDEERSNCFSRLSSYEHYLEGFITKYDAENLGITAVKGHLYLINSLFLFLTVFVIE